MPFKSLAQKEKFKSLVAKGDISKETNARWEAETGDANLPWRVAEKAASLVAEFHNGVTPEDVHKAADRAGVPWDNDKKFMDLSENVTGVRHLDDMRPDQLQSVISAVRLKKAGARIPRVGSKHTHLLDHNHAIPTLGDAIKRIRHALSDKDLYPSKTIDAMPTPDTIAELSEEAADTLPSDAMSLLVSDTLPVPERMLGVPTPVPAITRRAVPPVKVAKVKVGPPPSRNRKEYPYQGIINFQGLPEILVENTKGSVRSGTGPKGKKWESVMPMHYGEFRGSKGTDGDPVDVFVGPDEKSQVAYIVHTKKPPTFKQYDEDKVVLGFSSLADAKATFAKAYDNKKFWGSASACSVEDLGKMLRKRSVRGAKLDQSVINKRA